MISPEEVARIQKLADEYRDPAHPRAGHQTVALYDKLIAAVTENLGGLLEAAAVGARIAAQGGLTMTTHYISVREAGVYVKEAEFFKSQGGLTEPWGKTWEPITAANLYDARRIAIARRRERWPNAHRTIGEGEPMEKAWPEAAGQ